MIFAGGAVLAWLAAAAVGARLETLFHLDPVQAGPHALGDSQVAQERGDVEVLAFPDFFPNQGGLPIKVDGQVIGGISASGAKSEIDEAIAQAGIDALLKK